MIIIHRQKRAHFGVVLIPHRPRTHYNAKPNEKQYNKYTSKKQTIEDTRKTDKGQWAGLWMWMERGWGGRQRMIDNRREKVVERMSRI